MFYNSIIQYTKEKNKCVRACLTLKLVCPSLHWQCRDWERQRRSWWSRWWWLCDCVLARLTGTRDSVGGRAGYLLFVCIWTRQNWKDTRGRPVDRASYVCKRKGRWAIASVKERREANITRKEETASSKKSGGRYFRLKQRWSSWKSGTY